MRRWIESAVGTGRRDRSASTKVAQSRLTRVTSRVPLELSESERLALLRHERIYAFRASGRNAKQLRNTGRVALGYVCVLQVMLIVGFGAVLPTESEKVRLGVIAGLLLFMIALAYSIWRTLRPAISWTPDPLLYRRRRAGARGLLLLGFAYGVGTTTMWRYDGGEDLTLAVFMAASWVIAGTGLAAWLSLALTTLTRKGSERALAVRIPVSVIVHRLGRALEIAAHSGTPWLSGYARRRIADHLEHACYAVQWGLKQQLELGDRRSELWASTQLAEIAEGLRALKRSVAIANTEAPSHVTNQLAAALKAAIRQHWDDMDRKKPEAIVRSPAVTTLLVVAVLVVSGAVVAAAVWAFGRLGMAPLPPMVNTFVIVTGFILLTYVLSAVDPQITSRLALMREVGASMNPLGGKKG